MKTSDLDRYPDATLLRHESTGKTCTKAALLASITPLFKIQEIERPRGYPNARRDGLIFFVCQGCTARKLDIDLYQDTGLCGDCQFKEWHHKGALIAPWYLAKCANSEDCNCLDCENDVRALQETYESISADMSRELRDSCK